MGKRSVPGTPGSWHIQPEGDKFRLFWDFAPQKDAPLFASLADAEAWQAQWYAEHPPIEFEE
jgi:hypothetical protein